MFCGQHTQGSADRLTIFSKQLTAAECIVLPRLRYNTFITLKILSQGTYTTYSTFSCDNKTRYLRSL